MNNTLSVSCKSAVLVNPGLATRWQLPPRLFTPIHTFCSHTLRTIAINRHLALPNSSQLVAQIANRQGEAELEHFQQIRHEQVPTTDATDEKHGSHHFLHLDGDVGMTIRQCPVRSRKNEYRHCDEEETKHKDDIGAEGAKGKSQSQESKSDQAKRETGIKLCFGCGDFGGRVREGRVGSFGVEHGTAGECEPCGAKGSEDEEGECVAEKPFHDAGDELENAAKVKRESYSCSSSAARMVPAHELEGYGHGGDEEPDKA